MSTKKPRSILPKNGRTALDARPFIQNCKMIKLGEKVNKKVMIGGRAVFRQLCCSCVLEFNTEGKIIRGKRSGGFEQWYEYDENGNAVHWKTNTGSQARYEYDGDGNMICWINGDGKKRGMSMITAAI